MRSQFIKLSMCLLQAWAVSVNSVDSMTVPHRTRNAHPCQEAVHRRCRRVLSGSVHSYSQIKYWYGFTVLSCEKARQ